MIRVNATTNDILEIEKQGEFSLELLALVNNAFNQFKETLPDMNENIEFYKGKKPFNKNYYYSVDFTAGGNIDFEEISKQNINYAKYIVDQETSIFVGKAPQITTSGNKSGEIKRVNEFNRYLGYRNWKEHLTEAMRYKSKVGRGYLLVHNKENDEFPRFSELDPLMTFVAYDQFIDPESLFGCYVSVIADDEYMFYVFTPNFVYTFVSKSGNDGVLSVPLSFEKTPHYFGRVPINEFRNDKDEQSSIEPVKGLISLICAIQNDIVRGNHEAVKSILHIDGLKVGTKDEQETFFDLFVRKGMMITENGATAKILNNDIKQSEAQNTKKQALQDLWAISRTANFADPEFAQSASEPALKLKLKGVLDKALDAEKNATPTIKRIMKCVLAYVEHESPSLFSKIKLDINRMIIKYFHPLPSSDLATATIQSNLYNIGAWSPELLSEFTFMPEDIETYMETVVKKPEYQVEKEAQGNNETNRDRQNEVPNDMNQEDNFKNFADGEANKL
jgi:SPP1 family phage portal protein